MKDINWGRVCDPGWYRVRIDSVGERTPSKDAKSENINVEGEVLYHGDNGAVEFSGVGLKWNFNSKAMGGAVGFLRCFGVEVKPGVRIELKAAEGQELDVYVENDTWQGRVVNRVNHKYRKPKDDVKAVV